MPDWPFEELLGEVAGLLPGDAIWAVTCGSALRLHGLDYQPSDLDFFAARDDAGRLADALGGLERVFPFELRRSDVFASYWGRFRIRGVEVDVVGDFSIRRDGSLYLLDINHPCWTRLCHIPVGELSIPVFSLEDMLLLYLALPDEQMKAQLVHRALSERGCDRPYLRSQIEPSRARAAGIEDLICA